VYQVVCRKLVSVRQEAGLTQRQLPEKLEGDYSFVWRIERANGG
jgi:transcriptional regulator with XRE-family HTH domain